MTLREHFSSQLADGAAELGISLTPSQIIAFSIYADLLTQWNRTHNLTRVDPADTVSLHFLDSLSLAKVSPLASGTRLLDAGTGAGFPGLPLAIAFPGLHVTLADATRKKLDFVQEVVNQTALTGVEIVHGRLEQLAHEQRYREQFDLVAVRGVSRLVVLVELLVPFVTVGGTVVALKNLDIDAEIEEALPRVEELRGRLQCHRYTVPGTTIIRAAVTVTKEQSTPARFPRSYNAITRGASRRGRT